MQITIDTSLPLNDLERGMLSLLLTGEVPTQAPSAYVEPVEKVVTRTRTKPKPEPMAEEPLEVEEEPEVEEPEVEETDDELLVLAVKKATDMVAAGQAAAVREALDSAGASRVRELNKDNVREFFKALS